MKRWSVRECTIKKQRACVGLLILGVLLIVAGCGFFQSRDTWDIGKEGKFVYAQTTAGRVLTFESRASVESVYRVLDLKNTSVERENLFGGVAALWGVPLADMPDDRPFHAADVARGEHMFLIPATAAVRDALREKVEMKKGCWAKITLVGDMMQLIEEDHLPTQNAAQFFYVTDFNTTW